MSRKNLSRTVIEGGRYYHNSDQRRASHGIERATTREWLDRVLDDLDEADASIAPPRPHVGKVLRDKLAPAHRWLAAQIGRPWSKVYSELCARFDTRTVAGRHVVHDHMLPSVRRHDEVGGDSSHSDFVIDKHGILRRSRYFGRSYSKRRREALAWASNRVCALTYRGWWWFGREPLGAPCYLCSHKQHYRIDGIAYPRARLLAHAQMTRPEVRYLDSLEDELRVQLVVPSPWLSR